MESLERFKLPTCSTANCRSIQLSYKDIKTDYGSVGPSALKRRWDERRKRLD